MSESHSTFVAHDGTTLTLDDTADRLDIRAQIPHDEFVLRISQGETPEDILGFTPDVVLVTVGLEGGRWQGLGVEGAFVGSSIPVVRVNPTRNLGPTLTRYTNTGTVHTSRFDAVFTPSDLQTSDGCADLLSLIDEYSALTAKDPTDTESILKLLEPPKRVANGDTLDGLIPVDVMGEDVGTRRLADWLRDRFLDTPGLLVSTTRAALRLGMTVPAFEARAETFESATYTGAFCDEVTPRWWLDELQAIAHKTNISLDDSERAVCAKCGEPNVDRAAEYRENHLTTLQPVHYKCSAIERVRAKSYLDARTVDPTTPRHRTLYERL